MTSQYDGENDLLNGAHLPLEALNPDENFDEFLEFGDSLSLGDGGLDSAAWSIRHTPPSDGDLYSTSVPWGPPQSKPTPVQEKARSIFTSGFNPLSRARQEELRNIAMPDRIRYDNQYSPESASSTRTFKSGSAPSPDAQGKGRKRKSSTSADDEDDEEEGMEGQPPPVKKTAHNMIEKRYRTNLNDKIAALRDSVPSLRAVRKNGKGGPDNETKEDLQGLTPAHKLNKATVLSKATEYIRHLEKQKKRLLEENGQMKARISAFECLFMSGSVAFNSAAPTTANLYVQERFMNMPNTEDVSPGVVPPGMIEVPDEMKRLHAASGLSQQTYAVPQENYRPNNRIAAEANGWQNSGRMFGKMMVGSLAALMVLEGFSEQEQDGIETNGRGLFALPTQLLGSLGKYMKHFMDFSVLGYHSSSEQTSAFLRIFLVFGILLYIFNPSIFNDKLRLSNRKLQPNSLAAAPSPASPIQVRQQAWLTATQTIWIPRHNFFLEAAALCLKMAKLSLRNAIGWYGYSLLTGLTEQQDAARVKAWSIALDAQLAGGDMEINKSRLILTLIASGTIPDTPALLMLKALHVRVLLWEFGRAGFNKVYMFSDFAAKLARWKWNEARQLQQLLSSTGELLDNQNVEMLPRHLSALLEYNCDEVMDDVLTQRAYNLAFNLPTSQNSLGSDDGMDDVVNDFAIRSPLDAAAAWFSTLILQRALTNSVKGKDQADSTILSDINIAFETAPIGSSAQLRALIARAVLSRAGRGADIAAASHLLIQEPQDDIKSMTSPTLINSTTCIMSFPDLQISLYCSMAIARLQASPSPAHPKDAYRIINEHIRPVHLGFLGFTAVLKLMESIASHKEAAVECSRALEAMAGNLRIWVGGEKGLESSLSRETKENIIERCLVVTKQCIGMEKDAGYETMSDQEVEGER